MAKKYTRKQVSSLHELDLEQERIKYKTRRIEDDMLEVFNPQQLAISLIGKWLSRKSAPKESSRPLALKRNKKGGKPAPVKDAIAGFVSKPAVKSVAKKIGISFLKWQAFNLALFAGKKIVEKIKERRREKKLRPATS